MIFVVISAVVVALIYSSIATLNVYAVPPDPGYDSQGTCGGITTNPRTGNNSQSCCWTERVPGKLPPSNKATYCQTCEFTTAGTECKPKQQQIQPLSGEVFPLEEGVLEQPPTPPSGPAASLQEGVLEQQEQSEGALPELGFLERQQHPPATKGTQPAVEPSCPEGQVFDEESGICVFENCPEGQVLDEETGFCVLEEPETTQEPEEQPKEPEAAEEQPEEQPQDEEESQPAEENGSDEETSNNN